MTAIDHELVKSTRKVHPASSCLGCSVSFPSKQLAKHERMCPVYRDWFDTMLHAEIQVRSQQLQEQSDSTQQMVDRISWQEERIDDLEDTVDEITAEAASLKRKNNELRSGVTSILTSIKGLLKRTRAPTPPPQHRYFEADSTTDEEDDTPSSRIHQRRRFAPAPREGPAGGAAAQGRQEAAEGPAGGVAAASETLAGAGHETRS